MTGAPAPRLAVGIATRGRPAMLAETLAELRHQSLPPARVLVCGSEPADLCPPPAGLPVTPLLSPPGSAVQRNALIDAAGDCDILLFLDDDFFPDPGYIAASLAAFAADPAIVVTTGTVLADGARGPGLSPAAARAILAARRAEAVPPMLAPITGAYGCNMAVRLAAVRDHAARFDERLPLYAWYEDLDFSRRLGRHGRIVRVAAARGVHLGVKSGRTSGRRLGYSQVANPLYLRRKRVFSVPAALRSVARHLAINLLRAPFPEGYIDRRGRLAGNLLALADLLRGRLDPARVLEL